MDDQGPRPLRVEVAAGVGLHVRAWPPGTAGDGGRPVLLVHGLASNARLWDGVARRVAAAGHPAYAVDLRSHGESDSPAGGYDTATAARDLDAACDALALDHVVVAGQSWGGNVAVEFAAGFPARVAGLALVDGGWIDLRRRFDSWAACAERLRPPDLDGAPVDRMRRWIARSHPDWADWAVEATVANLRVDDAGRVHRRLPVTHHMAIVRSMWDDPPGRYHASIAAPTVLIPAGEPHHAREAARAIPHAVVRGVDGADHDVHAQHPDVVAEVLVGLAQTE